MSILVSGREAIALLTKLPKAKGRQRYTPGVMNSTEQAYNGALSLRKSRGEVLWYDFEVWEFKLAKGLSYKPDFAVMESDGTFTLVEVKGRTKSKTGVVGPYIQNSALERLKICAQKFPMLRWIITWPLAGGIAWGVREVEG